MVIPVVALASFSPAVGFDSTTLKASSASRTESRAIDRVTVFTLCPAAKLIWPEGSTPPVKSAASTVAPLRVCTAQSTVWAAVVSPSRAKTSFTVFAPVPVPSTTSGVTTAIDTLEPSLSRIELVTLVAASVSPTGFERLRLKVSVASTVVSWSSGICTSFRVSPAAKVRRVVLKWS